MTNGSRLMTYAQQIEEWKLKENDRESKKARRGSVDYSQQKSGCGNHSQFHQQFSGPAPTSDSALIPKFRQEKREKAPCSKSHCSVTSGRPFLVCQNYGKNHPREYMAGTGSCFRCSKSGHKLREYLLALQGGKSVRQKTQPNTLAAPAGHSVLQGASSSASGG